MSPVWSAESSVSRNPKVVWRGFDKELAVLDPSVGHLCTLNEVAARCWELCDGRTFEQLISQLLAEFEVERAPLEADVRRLLDQLAVRGLLDV